MPDSPRNMNVCFLLGSGASIPAGYPSVTKITEEILSGKRLGEAHSPVSSGSSATDVVPFLRWLKTVADTRYAREIGRTTNYEDIYFLASQIRDDLLGDFDNPAVKPLIEKVIVEFLLGHVNRSPKLDNLLEKLATDATDSIRRHVASSLAIAPKQLNHLDFVAEAIRDVGEGKIVLMTLNHDTLIESYLTAGNIRFIDGFSNAANSVKVRVWQPSSFADADESVHLLKLHGGIDWYRFRPDGAEPWSEDYVGIPTPEFSSGQKDDQQRRHRELDQLPIFLIGTFNKLISYSDPVYLELYHQGFRTLGQVDALVVIGCGFGDKGINKLVTEWIYRSPNRRLVVVDKYADTLWQSARGAISGKWHHLVKAKRLVPIQRDLKENNLRWQEIADVLRTPPR